MAVNLRIASACTASWELMAGDDRVRHCAQCNLNVYNFAELTQSEIDELVARREGRLCGRLYRRADGTMITKDCPVGFQMRVRRISRIASAIVVGTTALLPAAAQTALPSEPQSATVASEGALIDVVVSDPSGAVIPNARVTLVNQSTHSRIDSQSDTQGLTRFLDVPTATYVIEVAVSGFKAVKIANFRANSGQPLGIEVHMELMVEALMGEVVTAPNVGVKASDLSEYGLQPTQNATLPRSPSWLHKLRNKLHF